MTASAIDDSEGVDAIAVTDGKGIEATNFTEDMAPPEFVDFSLDINAATLAMTFSESINLSSLLVNNLTLYSDEIILTSSTPHLKLLMLLVFFRRWTNCNVSFSLTR